MRELTIGELLNFINEKVSLKEIDLSSKISIGESWNLKYNDEKYQFINSIYLKYGLLHLRHGYK